MLVYICKTPVPFYSTVLQVPDLTTSLPDCSPFFFSFPLPSEAPCHHPWVLSGALPLPHPYTFILSKGSRKGPSHHLSKPGYQVTWQLQPSLFLPSLQTRTEAIFVCSHLLESFHLQKYQEISGELLTVEIIKQSFPPYKEMSESSSLWLSVPRLLREESKILSLHSVLLCFSFPSQASSCGYHGFQIWLFIRPVLLLVAFNTHTFAWTRWSRQFPISCIRHRTFISLYVSRDNQPFCY